MGEYEILGEISFWLNVYVRYVIFIRMLGNILVIFFNLSKENREALKLKMLIGDFK